VKLKSTACVGVAEPFARGPLLVTDTAVFKEEARDQSMRIGTLKSVTLLITVLAACSGCGKSEGVGAPLIPVKGKVTYKGQPLAQGTVTFESQDSGKRAMGKLHADGTFVMSTYKQGDGVVAGEHSVIISGVDKTLARDRAFKKYMFRSYGALTAEVRPDNTEFTFDLK
jgi:hypothetical protein